MPPSVRLASVIESGYDIRTVQGRLGLRDASTTMMV
jgi:site-specific recombinase XerD